MRERAERAARRLTPRCEEIQEARAQFLPDPVGTRDHAAARSTGARAEAAGARRRPRPRSTTLIEQGRRAHPDRARGRGRSAERIEELLDPAAA